MPGHYLTRSPVPAGSPAAQVSKLLQYAPQKRMTAVQAMTHPFFDELRDPATRLPNGKPVAQDTLAISGLPRWSVPSCHRHVCSLKPGICVS